MVTVVSVITSADFTFDLNAPANPLPLSVSFDNNTSVKKMILAKNGGSIELTDKRGTKFHFSIPALAIDNDTEISLTAIQELGGDSNLPADKTFAVKIEPSGLEFLAPATLTITPTLKITASETTPFSFYQQGANIHLALIDPDPNQFKIKIQHLSGYGIGQSTTLREKIAVALSELKNDRMQNEIAKEFLRMRDENSEFRTDFIIEKAETYFREVIKRQIDNMDTCAGGRAALSSYSNLLRLLVISGMEDAAVKFREKLQGYDDVLFSKSFFKCNKEFGEACVNDHKLQEFIQYDLSMRKYFGLLGIEPENMNGFKDMVAWEKRCFNFEVHFKSAFENREMPGPNYLVDLTFDYTYPFLTPEIPTEVPYSVQMTKFESGQDSGLSCKLNKVDSQPAIFKLHTIDFLKLRSGQENQVGFWFDPGLPVVRVSALCHSTDDPDKTEFPFNIPSDNPADETSLYTGYLTAAHMTEVQPDGVFKFIDFQNNVSNVIILKKYYSRFNADLMQTETLDITVTHKPK